MIGLPDSARGGRLRGLPRRRWKRTCAAVARGPRLRAGLAGRRREDAAQGLGVLHAPGARRRGARRRGLRPRRQCHPRALAEAARRLGPDGPLARRHRQRRNGPRRHAPQRRARPRRSRARRPLPHARRRRGRAGRARGPAALRTRASFSRSKRPPSTRRSSAGRTSRPFTGRRGKSRPSWDCLRSKRSRPAAHPKRPSPRHSVSRRSTASAPTATARTPSTSTSFSRPSPTAPPSPRVSSCAWRQRPERHGPGGRVSVCLSIGRRLQGRDARQ